MFDTAVFDTLEGTPHERRWSTAISFLLQAAAVGALLLVPLLYNDAIPSIHYVEQLTVPAGRPAQQAVEVVATDRHNRAASSEMEDGHIVAPIRIPATTTRFVDRGPVETAPYDATAVFTSTGPANQTSAVQQLLASNMNAAPPKPEPHHAPIRISNLSEGSLLRRVQPVYPPLARATHIQGRVVLAALIDNEGRIANLRLISGHPLLVKAASEAVQQWRYRPYILNGQPIEVETQITIVFSLN